MSDVKPPGPCPACGAVDAVPILYGLPTVDMGEAAGRGELVLGGCTVTGADPQWACRRCETRWGRRVEEP